MEHEKKPNTDATHKSKSPEDEDNLKKDQQKGARGTQSNQQRDQQRDSAGREAPFRNRRGGRGGYDEDDARTGKEGQRPPRFQQKEDESSGPKDHKNEAWESHDHPEQGGGRRRGGRGTGSTANEKRGRGKGDSHCENYKDSEQNVSGQPAKESTPTGDVSIDHKPPTKERKMPAENPSG